MQQQANREANGGRFGAVVRRFFLGGAYVILQRWPQRKRYRIAERTVVAQAGAQVRIEISGSHRNGFFVGVFPEQPVAAQAAGKAPLFAQAYISAGINTSEIIFEQQDLVFFVVLELQ